MVGNPYRWRASIHQLENRNATAGCLLAVLFAVPYVLRSGQVGALLVTSLVIVYVTVVVPLLTGILTKKTLISFVSNLIVSICDPEYWKDIFRLICFISEWSHFLYMQCDGVQITAMQIMFNIAAERAICPEQKLCSLYVLLFYSVLAYLQRALQNRPWAHLLTENSTAEFLKLTTAFMIVRLGKAVAMSLVMLTISIQFQNMEPSIQYVLITFSYFCLTQYQNHPSVLNYLTNVVSRLDLLDGLEEFWVPFLLKCVMLVMSAIVAIACIIRSNSYYVILLIFCYSNFLVPILLIMETEWFRLRLELKKLKYFPLVSWIHPAIRAGEVCAICLEKLKFISSRVTGCGHIFHGCCLRRSLRYSPRCPLCKSKL